MTESFVHAIAQHVTEAVADLILVDQVFTGDGGALEHESLVPRESRTRRLLFGGQEQSASAGWIRKLVSADPANRLYNPRDGHCAGNVQLTGALIESVEAWQGLRRVHQKHLDRCWESSLEFASNKRAAAPATIGADIDVPLRYISFMLVVEYLFVSSSGYFLARALPTACAAMILLPGATRSGLMMLS